MLVPALDVALDEPAFDFAFCSKLSVIAPPPSWQTAHIDEKKTLASPACVKTAGRDAVRITENAKSLHSAGYGSCVS